MNSYMRIDTAEYERMMKRIASLEAELAIERNTVRAIEADWQKLKAELAAAQNHHEAHHAEIVDMERELADLRASLGATNATDMTCRGGKEPTI